MMITTDQKQSFTQYMILGSARQILPLVLDATKNAECRRHAEKLRGLADDVSMDDICQACEGASRAAGVAGEADVSNYARVAARNADGDTKYEYYYDYVAFSDNIVAGTADVYAGLLIEAAKRLPADAVPIIPDMHRKMYATVTLPGNELEMEIWHTCETTHCRAGWAVTLGGEKGKALEDAFGPSVAGGLIYAINTGMVPDFYITRDSVALADMEEAANAA